MISKEEFEQLISITPEGVAINNATGNPITWTNGNGNLKIKTKDGYEMIHRLVWMYHNNWEKPDGSIIHKDGNKFNNSISNLELRSKKAPTNKSYGNTRVPLSDDIILEIGKRYTYDTINGGLINNKTGQQSKGIACGGRYRCVMIAGRNIYVHRIVWMMHNDWKEPLVVIDHINGDSLDNRIENLRDVSHIENMANRSNSSKYGKWVHNNKGSGFKIEFIFKGVAQFYSVPKLEDAMALRDKLSLDISNGVYELKRPTNSTLPICVFKKKSKTQKLPYLVYLPDREEKSFLTLEEATLYAS